MSTNELNPGAPDRILTSSDPGDDTARRYRFQWTWSAIVCCSLFDDTQDVVEVFCEHHEDVLLKHTDGTFTGHQVKTRESDQPVWKASDQQVKSACAKFVQLESVYSSHFRRYYFLTNHPLYAAANAKSLGYNLSQITIAATIADLPSPVSRWLRGVATQAADSENIAFHALKKTQASDGLPKLQDSSMRLIEALTLCPVVAPGCSHESIRRAAQKLVEECAKAAALDHLQTLPPYILAIQGREEEIVSTIAGKRLTVDRVRSVLQEGFDSTATLVGPPDSRVEPGRGSTDLLLKKLDAGGFSAVSRNSAEDLRDKADYLGIVWTNKLGRAKGLDRYEHIRSLTLNDASRAFEASKVDGAHFGPAMREELRNRFNQRRLNGEQLFDCTDEHLEGIAYSLTAECQIQWSTDRPWEIG